MPTQRREVTLRFLAEPVNVNYGGNVHGASTKTTHCIIIFVAVDEQGKPVPVPAWQPASDEDRALEGYARKLMELRQTIDAEMSNYLAWRPARSAHPPRRIMRLIAPLDQPVIIEV